MNRQFLLLLTGLALSIFPITLSLANPKESPPLERNPAGDSEAAGTRGGCGQQQTHQTNLTLLPWAQQLHATLSTHPAFSWYLGNIEPAAPPTMRFTLIEPGVAEPIYETKVIASSSGVWALKLPQSTPELALNKQYRWTVTLICNELKPSSNKSDWAWIERITPSPTLEQKLATAIDSSQRSQIYANAGLWHDVYEVTIVPNATQTVTVFDPDRLPQNLQTWLERRGIAQK